MFTKINKLARTICEGGGVAVELTESPRHDSEESESEEDDDEEELKEGLFTKKVEHGKVKSVRNKLGDVEEVDDLHNNANLVKARIKARTPQAKLARKHSMLIRRRQVDGER